MYPWSPTFKHEDGNRTEQNIVEAKEVQDDGIKFVWRQKPFREFTTSQARD